MARTSSAPRKTPHDRAYERGFDGRSATEAMMADPELVRAFELGKQHAAEGRKPTRPGSGGEPPPAPPDPAPAPAEPRPAPFSQPNKQRGGASGGVLLALVAYPIALSIIRYGPNGPKMWLLAKFLNRTSAAQAAKAGQAPAAGGGTGGIGGGHQVYSDIGYTAPPGQATGTSAGLVTA